MTRTHAAALIAAVAVVGLGAAYLVADTAATNLSGRYTRAGDDRREGHLALEAGHKRFAEHHRTVQVRCDVHSGHRMEQCSAGKVAAARRAAGLKPTAFTAAPPTERGSP